MSYRFNFIIYILSLHCCSEQKFSYFAIIFLGINMYLGFDFANAHSPLLLIYFKNSVGYLLVRIGLSVVDDTSRLVGFIMFSPNLYFITIYFCRRMSCQFNQFKGICIIVWLFYFIVYQGDE